MVKTKAIVQLTDVYDIHQPSPKQQPVSSTTGEHFGQECRK